MIPSLTFVTTGGSKCLDEFTSVAGKQGFGGIDYDIVPVAEIIEQKSAATVRQLFAPAGVDLASFGPVVEFRALVSSQANHTAKKNLTTSARMY